MNGAFRELAANGIRGQMIEQGGNYYVTDPVESRNFQRFVARARMYGDTVLVAGCGDGAETELLVREGFTVTAFDSEPEMVYVTRREGLRADVHVADVTDIDGRYRGFAGVMFAQVAQFLAIDDDDRQLRRALTSLAEATRGALFISTTQYANPKFSRPWVVNGRDCGATTYYARPIAAFVEPLRALGMVVTHHEHFDAGDEPPDDYKNDYFIAEVGGEE